MKDLGQFIRIYLYRPPTDMRKQSQGLATIVAANVQENWDQNHLYLFTNKRCDILKMIYWDITGFALWTKKLDQERFPWPKKWDEQVVCLSAEQVKWLLKGINIWSLKQHKKIDFERII